MIDGRPSRGWTEPTGPTPNWPTTCSRPRASGSARRFFVGQGYVEPEAAFQEARRGTYNPTYLYYTLGKLQILKLREDCRRARRAGFTLRGFHDEFVRQGGVPVKLVRRLMLPGDTGPTL